MHWDINARTEVTGFLGTAEDLEWRRREGGLRRGDPGLGYRHPRKRVGTPNEASPPPRPGAEPKAAQMTQLAPRWSRTRHR